MTHARKQIRDEFVAAVQGLTTYNTVINGQRFPKDESQLPLWVVYYGDEAISEEEELGAMGASRTIIRELQIVALGMCRAPTTSEPVEDTLDAMLEELELTIGAKAWVVDVLSVNLVSVSPEYDTDADNTYGSLECQYSILYRTTADDPATIV